MSIPIKSIEPIGKPPPIVLSKEGIPVEISNCEFLKEGFVPDIVGSLILGFAPKVIPFASKAI